MALRINQTIETRDGFSVPSGTIVRFQTIFPETGTELHCNMKFYKDESTINNGGKNYFPSNLNNLGYVKELTESEYTGLTTVNVHVYLKDYLETIYTGGTIDIISL